MRRFTKRGMAIILTAAMCLSALAGCGASKDAAENQDAQNAGTDTAESAESGATKEPVSENSDANDDVADTSKYHAPFLSEEEWAIPDVDYTYDAPTGEVESDIFVTKIDGISDDFIRGMDISSYVSEIRSGVKYYDEDGNEECLFKILADAGINYIRIRVWNDPYDEDGNGYGGGNCDVETAAWMGAYAAKYGLKTCIDFHYSDFWADPNKQMSPKAWMAKSVDEKTALAKEYTIESLNTIIDAGTDLGMVQIGNETNNGIAGIKNPDSLYSFIAECCSGAREVLNERNLDTKIAVHFTQIDNHDDTLKKAEYLKNAGADYDVFGVSYYTYWHGSFENMVEVLKDIENEYGVETCIMETAYPYTSEDTDGNGNSISGDGDILSEYPASVQGQAKLIRDVMYYANEADALGVFYWEGAWISVGGNDKAANEPIWEEYGSGWASSYAGSYDPNDAGKYYGGSSWDNQAMFDATGHPLSSLNVWKYVKYGANAPIEVLAVKDIDIELPTGQALKLPDTVDAIYNDSDYEKPLSVTWDQDEVKAIDVNVNGKYTVEGTCEDGTPVNANIKIASVNFLENGSFEDSDVSMWDVEFEGSSDPTDIQDKSSDAKSGNKAFHFWSSGDVEFTMSQSVENLSAGTYTATCFLQGGDTGSSEDVYMFVNINGEEVMRENVSLTGWVDWKNPVLSGIEVKDGDTVTVGVHVTCDAKGWGTMDDFELY